MILLALQEQELQTQMGGSDQLGQHHNGTELIRRIATARPLPSPAPC